MKSIKNFSLIFIALTFILLSGISISTAQEKVQPSLYERLGGIHAIATVVDDFVERVWVNDVLNQNPKNKQAMGLEKPALKYLATELLGQATGGPQKYTGRSLKEVHKNLNISEKEWDAFMADLKASLNKFKVPDKEQQEVISIVNSTKPDIVTVSNIK